MKYRITSSILFVIYGVLLAVGPHTIFAVCEQGEKMMRCGWAAKVETGLGIFVIYLAVINILCKEKNARFWLGFSFIGAILLAILIPAVIIGGCGMAEMACRAVAYPVIYILSGLALLFSIGNTLYLKRSLLVK